MAALVACAFRLKVRFPLWTLALVWLGARVLEVRRRALRALAALSSPRPRRSLTFVLKPPHADAVMPEAALGTKPCLTLAQHLLLTCGERGGLARTLLAIQLACKQTAALMRRGLRSPRAMPPDGAASCAEDHAADVDHLEDAAVQIFLRALSIHDVCTVAFEPCEAVVNVKADAATSCRALCERYAVVVSPLDGASQADAGASAGSIWSVYRLDDSEAAAQPADAHVLRSGRELVAAGYALHGCASLMVCALDGKVHGFTLEPTLGEYVLTRPCIRVPECGRGYCANHATASRWPRPIAAYVESLAHASPARSLRYVGSAVADAHRTLLHGGLLLCPAGRNSPNGKLRLLHVAAPMAFIAEAAGGVATDGVRPLLDLVPSHAQQRTPLFLGSPADMRAFQQFVQTHPDAQLPPITSSVTSPRLAADDKRASQLPPQTTVRQASLPCELRAPHGQVHSCHRAMQHAPAGAPAGTVPERVRALETLENCMPGALPLSPRSHYHNVEGLCSVPSVFKPASH